MTVGNIIVLGIVILVIAGAIAILIRDHRSGKCSCGCDDCSGCSCGRVTIEEQDDKGQ